MAKQELLASIQDRYRELSRNDKSKILDEFIAVTGHHRKHGTRLLARSSEGSDGTSAVKVRRIYDDAVRDVVVLIWEASDCICGKRLKAAMPHLVESMERHGHPDLDPEVKTRVLSASAATLDRLGWDKSRLRGLWKADCEGYMAALAHNVKKMVCNLGRGIGSPSPASPDAGTLAGAEYAIADATMSSEASSQRFFLLSTILAYVRVVNRIRAPQNGARDKKASGSVRRRN